MEVPYKKKLVVDYLNEVDYSVDPYYVPSDFAFKFVTFIKMVNGEEGEENKTPITHYRMLDKIVKGHPRIANLCHRGLAKTTLMAEYFILYLAVYGELDNFGRVDIGLYISDSIENGVKNLRKNLEYRYENSEFLKRFLLEAKFTDIRWEFKNREGHTLVFKGYGAQTGVRGAKEQGKRPQIALLDDLVSDEDARSATCIAAIENTVYNAIEFALHPTKSMAIWNGTPFNMRDPLYKAVESGAWEVNVFPVCERFPCTREEFRGSWPDRFDYDYVQTTYARLLKAGKIAAFNQELMLRIMSDDDRWILDEDIQWYSREGLLKNKSSFNFYITTDFGTSGRESADFSVVSVWAINSKGWCFWVDGVVAKQGMEKNIEDLFVFAQTYKPESVGIEISGQQGGFIPWIQQKMIEKNIFFNLATENNKNSPGIRPNTDKLKRFEIVAPWFKTKQVFFPVELKTSKEMAEAMEELTSLSRGGVKSKHDDFLDSISMLGMMYLWRPGEAAPMKQRAVGHLWEMEDDGEEYSRLDSYLV